MQLLAKGHVAHMYSLKFNLLILLSCSLLFIGCGKEPAPSVPPGGGGGGGTSGTVAGFKAIPLPTVNLANLIIPNLAAFYVTNKGPYIQIQNSNQQRWSVYKYQGGVGTAEWSSFTPNFAAMNFIPTEFLNERDNEFSIHWASTDQTDDKYGIYNLNNGSPSFTFPVPEPPLGPGRFSKIILSKRGLYLAWTFTANEIWQETQIAVPKTFKKIVDIPSIGGYLDRAFADPDDATTLWCATQNRLYEVSSVGSGPGSAPGIIRSWNFSTISSSDVITTIMKVQGKIVVQFGDKVYRQDGSSFQKIGTLAISGTGTSNICTNGSAIFASDGTYYNSITSTWSSFIGTGTNLSAADQVKYDQLKAYCSGASPIGVINGSGQGPVYILTPTHLIQIFPSF